jgi:Popeye protein conserved region
MPYIYNTANVLYLISYLVKDILWLRLVTVVAGTLLIVNAVITKMPESVAWNLLFTAINLYQSVLLILERRPVRLTEEEQRLYARVFRSLTPREFRKLLGLAQWEDAPPQERIVEAKKALDRMMVIVSGTMAVRVGEREVAELGEGRFIGEMSFISGENPTADVVTKDRARFVAWKKQELKKFLDIGGDLVAKLRAGAM